MNESCFTVSDSEIKKFVCTTIRSVALLQNAHLLSYSSKEPQLVKRFKDLFHGIGFGNGVVFKDKNVSSTKPLCIPKGSDSWESIGIGMAKWEQVSFLVNSIAYTRIPMTTAAIKLVSVTNFKLSRFKSCESDDKKPS